MPLHTHAYTNARTGVSSQEHLHSRTVTCTLTWSQLVLTQSLAHMPNDMLTCLLTQTHTHPWTSLGLSAEHPEGVSSLSPHLLPLPSILGAGAMNGQPLHVGTELGKARLLPDGLLPHQGPGCSRQEPPSTPGLGLWENTVSGDGGIQAR